MIPVLKLPFKFDTHLMQHDLLRFTPEEWTPHYNIHYYEGDWSGIALRAPKDATDKLFPDPLAKSGYENTGFLQRCTYLPEVLSEFKCELESARLLKLAAGSAIREHRDYFLGYEDGVVRVHIPVETNPNVEFFHNGQRVEMQKGEAWYLNFNLMHSVVNKSTEDRVHLVVDCVLNDWLDSFFPGESQN